MTAITSPITRLFGIRHPVVLAPMGGVSGGRLAGAVSRAGGLGLVGASYGDPDWMRAELGLMSDVDAPWGVGLVMFTVEKNMQLLDLALSYRPKVVALSFGNPNLFVGRIKAQGALAVVQVHDVDQALLAVDAGADALIVQGAEAGGHNLRRALFPLLPAVRDAVGDAYPLIAAGGIADGRGAAAALALGANAVMLGTRFVATDESLATPKMRQRLIDSTEKDTVRTRAFDLVRGIEWPAQYSGRALANDFSAQWVGREHELKNAPDAVREAYVQAIRDDDVGTRAIWAGEVSDLVREVSPAADVVRSIAHDAARHLTQLGEAFQPEVA
ncbi:NAD(P)H-dependent flavin oxidoreductase [Burkholderia ubonensis]|uniref:2-nitropropane dioxygenase n=1 Tax=Burkholderia ubonensis subsp. mesacidophila TaxID=265293 RepID=A0A2A4ENF8_9BURK|nr:nitronate monooxygenase [Burkholderia ubonensis]PCE21649.1 2-nitropropane dioxygenase [Burkholderia ubonensis subsp. mesacidophila]